MPKLFPRRHRDRAFVRLILLVFCLCIGWGMAQSFAPVVAQTAPPPATVLTEDKATEPSATTSPESSGPQSIGTVDPIRPQDKPGQERYLNNCASCHIALPPAVLPRQTWANLLQDTEHYGAKLKLRNFDRRLIYRYLQRYSRPFPVDERTPYRVQRSRHFKALHPQVKLPRPLTVETCASCHPKANVFNFREWQGQ